MPWIIYALTSPTPLAKRGGGGCAQAQSTLLYLPGGYIDEFVSPKLFIH